MNPSISGNELLNQLRRALQRLYDPAELRRNPLPQLLQFPDPEDPVVFLRGLLPRAIAALRPAGQIPLDSNAQRYYDLLTYRFVEQSSQKEVAADMAISVRHLQRLEAAALRYLAETIALEQGLTLTWAEGDPPSEEELPALGMDQLQQEIDWLKRGYHMEVIDVDELIAEPLETLSPLIKANRVQVDLDLPGKRIAVMAQITPLKQTILHILSLLIKAAASRSIAIAIREQAEAVQLVFTAMRSKSPEDSTALREGLALAEQLVKSSGAGYQSQSAADFLRVMLSLTPQQQSAILALDDNQDTLLLLERFLTHSPYTFVGTKNPGEIFKLIDEYQPVAVILDVMLPGEDGWSLMAKIRQRLHDHNLPIIISTILPQEELALLLGADAFLHKPFTREQLLAALAALLNG